MPQIDLFVDDNVIEAPFVGNTGLIDGMVNSVVLSFENMPTRALQKWWNLSSTEALNLPKIPIEELKTRFPDVEWDRPMNEVAAQLIVDDRRFKAERAQALATMPDSTFYDIMEFGAALIPQAFDPLALAASFGVGSLSRALFMGSRVADTSAKAAAVLGASTKARAALHMNGFFREAAEGVIGNLVVEPIAYAQHRQYLEEYTFRDLFISTVGGAVGFAGIKELGKFIGSEILSRAAKSNQKVLEQATDTAIAQVALGKRVDLSLLERSEAIRQAEAPEVKKPLNMPTINRQEIIEAAEISERKENSLFEPNPELYKKEIQKTQDTIAEGKPKDIRPTDLDALIDEEVKGLAELEGLKVSDDLDAETIKAVSEVRKQAALKELAMSRAFHCLRNIRWPTAFKR